MPYKVFEGCFKDFKEEGGDLNFFSEKFFLDKKTASLQNELNQRKPVYSFTLAPLVVGLSSKKESGEKFRILDYGGGVGSTYLELEMSMESIEHIEYDIYDSLISCEGGKKYLPGRKNLKFISDISSLNQEYDLMHLGSVIQYIEDLKIEINQLFKALKQSKPRHILVTDAYVGSKKTYVTRCDYYGYKHPFKIRSWQDLLDDFSVFGYKLKSKQSFINKVGNKHEFYDMSNMQEDLRIENTWHLFFELEN